MATDIKHRLPTHPGLETSHTAATSRLRISDDEKQFKYHAANSIAAMEGKRTVLCFGGRTPYVSARVTETKQNSSTIAYAAGGLRFQTQSTPTDGDKVEAISVETATPVQLAAGGLYWKMSGRLQVSSAANLGVSFGFVTPGASGIIAADPADGAYFRKAKNSANLIFSTVQNGGTRHDSGTLLALADATDVVLELTLAFEPTSGSTWGEVGVNGAFTPLSSAQMADIYAWIAAATPLAAHIGFAVNGTTQRSATVSWSLAEVDR